MIAGIQEMISLLKISSGHRTPTPTYKQFKKHAAATLFFGFELLLLVNVVTAWEETTHDI